MPKKLLSFVIPAYNEEECVDRLYEELNHLFAQLSNYDCEAIIVENGSWDMTYEKLLAIHSHDHRFKILKLARNFMTDGGMTAGLRYAGGDAVILMCADLEDPPQVVHEFLHRWEEGFMNVYGIIRHRQGPWLRRLNSRLFYSLVNRLTGGVIPRYVSDFRLIDRKVVNAINTMNERNRMLRGLVAWLGYKSCGVPFDRGNRPGGVSKANTLLVLKLALRGIFAFSYVPLRMATLLGVLLSGGSFLAIALFTIKFFMFGVPFNGYGTIVCLVLLLFGFLFTILGIMSEYIGMIFEEVKARPNFIVEEEIGFSSHHPHM